MPTVIITLFCFRTPFFDNELSETETGKNLTNYYHDFVYVELMNSLSMEFLKSLLGFWEEVSLVECYAKLLLRWPLKSWF